MARALKQPASQQVRGVAANGYTAESVVGWGRGRQRKGGTRSQGRVLAGRRPELY